MTYSSRNFLISWGTGREDRAPPRASNRLSSAMMSLQTSTHSSQMKTVGPAISLRTSFWSLLQNEQRRISESPFFFTAIGLALAPGNHLVHDTILARLGCVHDEVAVGVDRDLLHRLPAVEGQDLVQALLHAQDLLGLDGDVRGLALGAAPGLVDHDARVGEREALAGGAGGQQHGAHGRRLAHADRLHV